MHATITNPDKVTEETQKVQNSAKNAKKHNNKKNKIFPSKEEKNSMTPEELDLWRKKFERDFKLALSDYDAAKKAYDEKISETLKVNPTEEVVAAPEEVTEPVKAPEAVVTAPAEEVIKSPFDIDENEIPAFTVLTADQIAQAMAAPTDEQKVIIQMIEDRAAAQADEEMKGLAGKKWKNASFLAKPFSFLNGIRINLTSAKAYETAKNNILYENGEKGKPSKDFVAFYNQLSEVRHYAKISGGAEKELYENIEKKAVVNSKKAPRTGLLGKLLNTGIGRNLKDRFGVNGMKVKANTISDSANIGLKVSGAGKVAMLTTAFVYGTRRMLSAVPIIGAGVAAGIFGAVAEDKKQKSLKSFIENHLANTALSNMPRYPTLNQVKERLAKSKNPYFQLKFIEELLNRVFASGRQDNTAGIDGYATLLTHVKYLRKKCDHEIQTGSQKVKDMILQGWSGVTDMENTASVRLSQIKKKNRNDKIKMGAIASVLGMGAAGIVMSAGAMLSSTAGTPTSSLEALRQSASAKAASNHSVVNYDAVNTATNNTIAESVDASARIPEQYIDGYKVFGNTKYAVLRANDGGKNYPIFALPDGRIPYNVVIEDPKAVVTPASLAANTRELRMNLGTTVLRPVADNTVVSPIEVHIISKEQLIADYGNKATTKFINGKRVIYCTPEYVNEELLHAAFGISHEPGSHKSITLAGTKGHIDGGEQQLILAKRDAILRTNNANALAVGSDDAEFASEAGSATSRLQARLDAQMIRIQQMQKELYDLQARKGNVENTRIALEQAKEDLKNLHKSSVDKSTLERTMRFSQDYELRTDGVASFFGSHGSKDPYQNMVVEYVRDLNAKGVDPSEYSDRDQKMVEMFYRYKDADQGYANDVISAYEADNSLEGKEELVDFLDKRYTNIVNENYAMKLGDEAFSNNWFDMHPGTSDNIDMYLKNVFYPKEEIKQTVSRIERIDVANIRDQIEAQKDYIAALEKQYLTEQRLTREFEGKYLQFKQQQVAARQIADQIKVLEANAAASSSTATNNLNIDTDLNTYKAPSSQTTTTTTTTKNTGLNNTGTGDTSVSSSTQTTTNTGTNNTVGNNTVGNTTTTTRTTETSTGTNTTSAGKISREATYYAGVSANTGVKDTVDEYLYKLNANSNGREMLNTLMKDYYNDPAMTPAQRSAMVINKLEDFINQKSNSTFQQGYTPKDIAEVAEIKINGYSLKTALENDLLKGNLDQVLTDNYQNEAYPNGFEGITEEEESIIYDPKTSNWVLANWVPNWLKDFYAKDAYWSKSVWVPVGTTIAKTAAAFAVIGAGIGAAAYGAWMAGANVGRVFGRLTGWHTKAQRDAIAEVAAARAAVAGVVAPATPTQAQLDAVEAAERKARRRWVKI